MKTPTLTVQNKLFLSFALVVGGLVVAVIGYVGTIVSRQAGETIAEDLRNSLKVFEALQREKTANLRALLANISEAPRLKAALDLKKQDPATVADLAAELRGGLDLLQVADKKGRLLFGAMGDRAQTPAKIAASASPFDALFARAVDPENPVVSAGAMTWEGRIFITMTGPVIAKDRVVGALRAGFELGEKQAKDLRDQTGSEVAFTIGTSQVAVSSLPPSAVGSLQGQLTGMKPDAMGPSAFELALDGQPYVVQIAPLADPGGATVGWQVQLRSRARVLKLLSRVRGGVLTIGLTGLVVAVGLIYLIARGIASPLKDLVRGTREVDRGNLEYRVPVRTRDELGVLAEAFNTMIADLKEKERVKAVFGRYLPKAVADRAMAHEGELMLGGEERDVAIFFSDVRGFTALSENMPPQKLVGQLNEYFTAMTEILFEHDGTLDKLIGDAVMAVFGAPVADADAPAKAVRTALRMQASLRELNRGFEAKGLPRFEIGIGINTGVVVAGNLGSSKQLSYTVIGEEVNLASRLCSKAGKGQILISESVFRKVKWGFECNRLEPITVKNVSYPVQVYEVVGERADGGTPGDVPPPAQPA